MAPYLGGGSFFWQLEAFVTISTVISPLESAQNKSSVQ